MAGAFEAARRHGLDHEHLGAGELQRRYPELWRPDGAEGFFEPDAGALLAEPAVAAFAEAALLAGATLHGHTRVLAWQAVQGGVRVESERGSFVADRLVLCGGPWSRTLLLELDVPLTVTRQVLGWFWPREPARFVPERFPVWGIDDPDGPFLYGFPLLPGRPGLKVARHHPGEVTTPDAERRAPDAADRAEIEAIAARVFSDQHGTLLSLTTCLYTNSSDGHFLIDRHPLYPQVAFGAGFSGHGFKFAPVVGEALADLATSGSTGLPIGFLGLARLGR